MRSRVSVIACHVEGWSVCCSVSSARASASCSKQKSLSFPLDMVTAIGRDCCRCTVPLHLAYPTSPDTRFSLNLLLSSLLLVEDGRLQTLQAFLPYRLPPRLGFTPQSSQTRQHGRIARNQQPGKDDYFTGICASLSCSRWGETTVSQAPQRTGAGWDPTLVDPCSGGWEDEGGRRGGHQRQVCSCPQKGESRDTTWAWSALTRQSESVTL